ncbi:hypothetical protein, partial [Paracoccus sanguinis]|uniref:hypothetical protein n=1 Tax=Paracoccus sanguinis TaxID=1545044 RepID=UPI001E2EC4D7
ARAVPASSSAAASAVVDFSMTEGFLGWGPAAAGQGRALTVRQVGPTSGATEIGAPAADFPAR